MLKTTEALADVLKPVLVFDSGIGGLTVLREARVLMPERGFIYVADDAGFPYGGWEEEALKARILSLFEKLLEDYSPEVCIIACNTAFTLAGADLRARFPDMTFVGTVPAIKPAAERTRSGLVSVLATPAPSSAPIRAISSSHSPRNAMFASWDRKIWRVWPKAGSGASRSPMKPCWRKSSPASSIATASAPISLFSPALIIPSWPMCFAGWRHGRWTGSIRRKRLPVARATVPLPQDAEHPDGFDFAVFTSGKPDFATRRLMQGFGLSVSLS